MFVHPSLRNAMTPPAGRPKVNTRRFMLKPTDRVPSGVEYLNTLPAAMRKVQEEYLAKHELPPALQPKYLRKPEVMDKQRAVAISHGWRKPRSRA